MFQKIFQFGDQTLSFCTIIQLVQKCAVAVHFGCCGPVASFLSVGEQSGIFHEIRLLFKNGNGSRTSLETPVPGERQALDRGGSRRKADPR